MKNPRVGNLSGSGNESGSLYSHGHRLLKKTKSPTGKKKVVGKGQELPPATDNILSSTYSVVVQPHYHYHLYILSITTVVGWWGKFG